MTNGLEGIKVIETASVMAGPMAGRLLADWGADVIHIEHPVRGDIIRSQTGRSHDGVIVSEIDYVAQNYNRNKRSMTLDLSHPEGRLIMYRLLEKADVFLSNFLSRDLAKFHLEYETLSGLNPRLICANLTGYGKNGPDRDLPGFETTGYLSRSGLLHLLQSPGAAPLLTPVGLGDNVAGLALAYGIMTALFLREKTGRGQRVDTSLFHAGVFTVSHDVAAALVTGEDRHNIDRKDVLNPLRSFYPTSDGYWVRLAMTQPDVYWARFCRVMSRPELEKDPRFASTPDRIKNHTALVEIVDGVMRGQTLQYWKERLDAAGIPWAPVQTLPQVIADPQARQNGFYAPVDHPDHGHIEVVTNPISLSGTPPAPVRPAPQFGQNTEEVLLEHGYTWEDIARFKDAHVIG
jgi:formyl-CoA transferase